MASRNDITGDSIATKAVSDSYRNNFDAIFRKPKAEPAPATVIVEEESSPTPEELERIRQDNMRRRWWAYVEDHQPAKGGSSHSPTFAEFRDEVLPGLRDDQYMKFVLSE